MPLTVCVAFYFIQLPFYSIQNPTRAPFLPNAQVIRCQHLAASQDHLQEWLSTFHPNVEQSAVHRCTAILDSPLVPGEQQSLMVVPPGALPGAVHAVRGLALSSSTKASPADRWAAQRPFGGWDAPGSAAVRGLDIYRACPPMAWGLADAGCLEA